jgi:hypothetical protein
MPQLPAELWIRIIGFSDAASQAACLQVSQRLRACAQEHCFLFDGRRVILHEPPVTVDDDMLLVVELFDPPSDATGSSSYQEASEKYGLYADQMRESPISRWEKRPTQERWFPSISSPCDETGSYPTNSIVLPEAAFKLVRQS